ncbi:retrovirus-related Pol polyprotein from transposon 412 [Trichonephila clavata]|uniref:Retrovirus-related Pol polyprotein from transposon 412 n=1 Tax=Trichonephila clavata TaxID=2740835 RepID=A0A8X6FF08_TRICU|nr:retrovirus-related Pol polyprotein from transposon 412 [Trichonephila clavata]
MNPAMKYLTSLGDGGRELGGLTENKQKFLWTDEYKEAFNSLKAALTSSPILVYPDPEKQFILDTDASHESVGAVLSKKLTAKNMSSHTGASVFQSLKEITASPEKNYWPL